MAVLKSLYAEFIPILFLLPSRHLTSFACKNKFAEIDRQILRNQSLRCSNLIKHKVYWSLNNNPLRIFCYYVR